MRNSQNTFCEPRNSEIRSATLSNLFQGEGRMSDLYKGNMYFYCVPAWRVTDWPAEKRLRIGPLLILCFFFLHLKRAEQRQHVETLRDLNVRGRKCFLFYRNRFHNPDDTERLWWSYASWLSDGTEMYIWRCLWNALKFVWVFFFSFFNCEEN